MARVLAIVVLALFAGAQAAPQLGGSNPAAHQEQGGVLPQIDWGQCQTLQPTSSEREAKRLVIEKCLDVIPIPEGNITAQQAEGHREEITTCALQAEGWFNQDGTYKFNRAGDEIRSKKLPKEIETEIVEQHNACSKEALEKFPQSNVQQVQLYQACMDYHIARICRIQVVPPGGQAEQ